MSPITSTFLLLLTSAITLASPTAINHCTSTPFNKTESSLLPHQAATFTLTQFSSTGCTGSTVTFRPAGELISFTFQSTGGLTLLSFGGANCNDVLFEDSFPNEGDQCFTKNQDAGAVSSMVVT